MIFFFYCLGIKKTKSPPIFHDFALVAGNNLEEQKWMALWLPRATLQKKGTLSVETEDGRNRSGKGAWEQCKAISRTSGVLCAAQGPPQMRYRTPLWIFVNVPLENRVFIDVIRQR